VSCKMIVDLDPCLSVEMADMHRNLQAGRKSRDIAWWIVLLQEGAAFHNQPHSGSFLLGQLPYSSAVVCHQRQGSWLDVSDASGQWLGWVKWKRLKRFRWVVDLKPLALIRAEANWVDIEGKLPVTLPEESLDWSFDEADLFIGSASTIRPSRQKMLERSGKHHTRAIRYFPQPAEYRVGEREQSDGGNAGVFALVDIKRGSIVEFCPLLRITDVAFRTSDVLRGLALLLPPFVNNDGVKRVALPLGFARLYAKSNRPNLRWDYYGDKDIILWAARDILLGDELTVELDGMPVKRPNDDQGEDHSKSEHERDSDGAAMEPNIPQGKLTFSGRVRHSQSSSHGRGVFALHNYSPGDIVESCPLVLLADKVGAKALVSYRWGVAGKPEEEYFLPLGLGGLYNHFEPPHARGRLDTARQVLEICAVMPIRKGQEIFVSYGDAYFDDDFASLGHSRANIIAPCLSSTPS